MPFIYQFFFINLKVLLVVPIILIYFTYNPRLFYSRFQQLLFSNRDQKFECNFPIY
jgi:hypothetical protein